uniref:Uncharacterized protein n=1 Tax=Romanomermis culicivorax TaxID=13658 RepID=A0A915HU62_ROMCU
MQNLISVSQPDVASTVGVYSDRAMPTGRLLFNQDPLNFDDDICVTICVNTPTSEMIHVSVIFQNCYTLRMNRVDLYGRYVLNAFCIPRVAVSGYFLIVNSQETCGNNQNYWFSMDTWILKVAKPEFAQGRHTLRTARKVKLIEGDDEDITQVTAQRYGSEWYNVLCECDCCLHCKQIGNATGPSLPFEWFENEALQEAREEKTVQVCAHPYRIPQFLRSGIG